jgi:uncharacterized membrane protein
MFQRTRFPAWTYLGAAILFLCFAFPVSAQIMTVHHAVHQSVSPAVRDLPTINQSAPTLVLQHEAEPLRRIPLPPGLKPESEPDMALQHTAALAPTLQAPTAGLGFEGLGNASLGFTVNSAPPDTNGAVGATQYVQWVNSSFAVFNKSTGALIAGPTAGNSLFASLGGGCAANNDGDPIAQYDKLANRWVLTQFSVTTTPFLQCVAVSTTSDATGTYNVYSFQYPNFDDYPKMSVWPDAYYITFNMFNGNTFVGADACAYDRNAMLNGQPATQVCFQQGSSVGGLLPSDLDGTTAPPAGSPNFLVFFGTNNLNLFKFHVDFATPGNSTFTGPTVIPVTAFSPLCGGGTCVPQAGDPQQLDSLADRLMYRLAYRNFGTHESLVVNHSVVAGAGGGVRWYEIQNPNGTPTVAQQSTFAPDSNFRWMGSVAMDKAGDMAMGYSVSGTGINPSIAFTGRLATDPASTMQTETTIISGSGAQNGGLTRWGDYSAITVDPVDDCTFWYTDEYIKTTGSFNWNTRIANFKFPSCGNAATPDFTLSSSPTSVTVTQGSSGSSTITVNPTNGFTGSVSLSASGLPAGVSASFNPASTTGTSSLTLTATGTATTGTATVTITGTSGSLSHTTTVTLTVNPAPNFTLSASPASVSVTQGSSASSTITVNPTNGFNGSVSLSASGLPSGVTASFNPASTTGTSSLTFTASATATTGTATVTITGASGSLTHTTTVTLTVNAAAVPNFTLSASPTSVSVTQGGSGGSTITVNPVNGFNGSVSLSASGLPSGVTASFNPGSTTTNSTVTFTASAAATTGTATVTITGVSGSLTHTTTISLTVNAAATPDFTLSASPTSVTVTQGGSGSSTITVNPVNGFNGSVSLSASGLPSGVTASFNPGSTTTNSTVTFTASGTATTGTSTVTITGTSGALTRSTTISLTVNAVAVPNFSLSASPASVTINRGASGTSTITVTPINGFNGSVSLTASGLPSGVTASFNPTSTTSTSTLTLTASSTATTGAATVTVTGTSGSLTHTTTIALTVNSGAVTQLLGNPGFENGNNTAPWTLTPAVINNSSQEPPHSGAWDAWLDGYGTTHTDTATQTVTIPSTATSANLSFWLHIDTAETTTTTAFDTLQVQVLNSSNTVLATLGTFSNLNAAAGYQQHSFSVIQFKGQTIKIRFVGTEDASLQTSFVLDDTALNVQ